MRTTTRRGLSLLSFLVLGAPSVAWAQASGFALDRFNPSERGSDWFEEDSLDFRGHLRPAVGIVGEYADRPLVILNKDGSTNSAPVHDQFILHPGASVLFLERLRLAFDLPIAVYEDGTTGAVARPTNTFPATATGGLGDLRLSADSRLVGRYGGAFSMAAGVSLYLPTGSQTAYLSDGNVRVTPHVAVAGDVGMVTYAAHVGFEVRPLTNELPGYPLGSELQLGGSIGVRALSRKLIVGPEVYAATVVTNGSAAFSTRQTPVEGLLGAHYAVADDWRVGAGIGMGLSHGFGEPNVRATLMAEWAPGYKPPPGDRDRDSVPDVIDACPDVPGPPSHDPRLNGCPATDRDKDGVLDPIDACPDVPGVRTDDPKTNGCPGDRDKDTVPDAEDACPDVPGVRMSDPKTNGCPPDSDHDGILDADDACPDVPGIRTSDPKTNGCPDLDRDKDGIPNDEDACPDIPGPRNADPKRNGCADAYLQDDLIKTVNPIVFPPGSAVLPTDKETVVALTGVLEVLAAHREIKHVRIESHVDNEGDAAANRALTAKRAAAIVAWLTARGASAGRLTSMGVGSDSPLQDNTSEAGRAANRRIEIHIEQ